MFKQITVFGPGLLGASVLQAVHKHGLAKRKVAWERDPKRAKLCSEQPWCDVAFTDISKAIESADFIVMATPVDTIVDLLRKIGQHIQPGTLVTDTGSTKVLICDEGHHAIQDPAHFIGSHPMAGSEKSGFEHSSETLLEGRTCLVTPLPQSDEAATEKIVHFWEALGMQVTCLSP
ncbi:MAG TPA: prephenate dehydrogenase/arogenate dehydrogenase family protein, partial [Opitutae bacterium]|nr:prephenate dehydrogenase/arogenate dehydrogenase family protein [Opitutae bacterium]